jgi:hypothetical protein
VGYPPGCFTKGAKPFRLDLLSAGALEAPRHFAKRRPERGKFRGTTTGLVRGERLHPANVPGPTDQLLDGAAQLAREMASKANRGVNERRAHQKDEQTQTGVVVAAKGVGPLKLADGGVQSVCVIGERETLSRLELGGVDGVEQYTAR